jgi:hypothetical protein
VEFPVEVDDFGNTKKIEAETGDEFVYEEPDLSNPDGAIEDA